MEDLILKTPTKDSDSIEGLNDGNIETYKNTPLLSLTKEELQNSTDQAKRDENGNPQKVKVEFKDFFLTHDCFPEYEKTKDIYSKERVFWNDYLENDKKAVRFFENAINLLNEDTIRCLRISDSNTTGLNGIHKNGSSPWNNLVKNKGVSDKPGYSGGSFGIGKDAAFACSQLRLVFYNTINEDGDSGFQGCMKVPNYIVDDKTFTGNNFYCRNTNDNKALPIEKSISLDPSYARKEVGMDKFIIGFDKSIGKENLKRDIIVSSINNFLVAFFMDTLEVKFDDAVVSQEKLDDIFNEYKDFLNDNLSIQNLETLRNPDDIIKLSMFEDEDIWIYVKLDPNYSRRASIVRQNGMKVFDRGYISARIGFNAVVYLKKNEVNKYFKSLENQEHNRWANERSDDPAMAQRRQDIIFDALRDKIKELNGAMNEESVDSDGLGEYLPYAYITGKKNKVESLTNEVEDVVKKVKPRPKKNPPVNIPEEVNYIVDDNGNLVAVPEHHGTNPTPPGPGPIPPIPNDFVINNEGDGIQVSETDKKGDFISKKEIPSKYLKMRLFKNENNYSLKVKSEENYKKGYFELFISGEDPSANLDAILSSATINDEQAVIKDNKILFTNLDENEMYNIKFNLNLPGEWALEVKAHESKN